MSVETGPAKGKIIRVVGLQRSGNHAVISWISSLYERTEFLNDMPHTFFDETSVEALREQYPQADVIIVSFEDTLEYVAGGDGMFDHGAAFFERTQEADDILTLVVLRHPYNTWASRTSPKRSVPITGDPDMGNFIRRWCAFCSLSRTWTRNVVRYESWALDRKYRQELCEFLGGTYSERSLNNIPKFGGGSSYDRPVRPSRKAIFKSPVRYFRKFLTDPQHYLRLFLGRRLPKGTDIARSDRASELRGDPERSKIFECGEMSELVDEFYRQ